MKEATKVKVATAVTVLFLAGISAAGLANRSGGDSATAELTKAKTSASAARTVASQPAPVVTTIPPYEVDEDDDEGFEESDD